MAKYNSNLSTENSQINVSNSLSLLELKIVVKDNIIYKFPRN